MNAVIYIGVTCARGGVYRRGGGGVVQLERLSVAAASRWPARLVRILLARALLADVAGGAVSGAAVEAFADEVLGEVEIGGLFALSRDCVETWIALRNGSAAAW